MSICCCLCATIAVIPPFNSPYYGVISKTNPYSYAPPSAAVP